MRGKKNDILHSHRAAFKQRTVGHGEFASSMKKIDIQDFEKKILKIRMNSLLLVVPKSYSMRKSIPATGYTFSQVTIWGFIIDDGFPREA